MRVLFDQGRPLGIREHLSEHEVETAFERGWSALQNGELLRAAEDAGFDVLLTTDPNLPYQQNLEGRRIAVVILNRNRWELIQCAIPRILAAIEQAKPGSVVVADIPAK